MSQCTPVRLKRLLFGLLATLSLFLPQKSDSSGAPPVDVALILAVDASDSVSSNHHRLQRQGYVDAIRHPALLYAIRSGRHGRIAMAYLEWGSNGRHHLIMPMTVIASAPDAKQFARHVASARHDRLGYTAMGAALGTAAQLLELSPYPAHREIIDLSANGLSNRGQEPHLVRDRLVSAGITINGLPIISDKTLLDATRLESYFADCVIGGAGAFFLPVADRDSFAQTLLAKMVHEIAGLTPTMPARLIQAGVRSHCWTEENVD